MIRDNVFKVRESVARACKRAGRNIEDVTIVAVSKNRAVEEIEEVIASGITDIGENKVQEGFDKHSNLQLLTSDLRLNWHMVGHLQTNKVKDAVRIFDLIHSVDSLHLTEEIDKQAAKINKIQDILIEVKTSPEETKFGLASEELLPLVEKIYRLKNIRLKGLMTIAPVVDNSEDARQYFKQLKSLFDTINQLTTIDQRLTTISMGMTNDFEVAIEEGANMIRLGRIIFGG